ncbi:YuzB family protein [Staphylococcus epidermidis]|uniref:YuzB family protein n=1 Tax=Staphylococcus epidermidis TaxID=1282 RepID=UPI0020946AB1|nr:YuzB family protein [Staphylococcus epidermidis]MCO6341141.1 YuzB family protein [Staphylococcus epidermidis]
MFPLVEFCISNMAKGSDVVFEKLENDPNIDVLEYGCLQNCGLCASSLYAHVDGDIVEGNTPDDLLKNIYQHIEDNDITNLL